MSEIFEELREAVIDGDEEVVEELSEKVLADGINPVDAMEKGLISGIEEVGNQWKNGEAFLPDVMMSADAMKTGLAILEPAIAEMGGTKESKGKIVIGTVTGDIHDIGKNICSAMLTANGYKVFDIGIDRTPEDFLAKAEEVGASIIAASALLTTTMSSQKELIEFLQEKNLRDKYKVIIGGGPTSKAWADEIGADGWVETADDAAELCKSLLA